MAGTAEEIKRETRSFLMARDPSVDRRFRPRPQTQARLFNDIREEEDSEDSASMCSELDDRATSAMSSTSDGDGALVYLRLRPVDLPSSSYTLSECGSVLITGPSNENTSTSNNKNLMEKHYSFSEIFTADVKQRDVFEKCIGKKIEIEENFTVLTYGTSGSGKTFTLLGDYERPGIIPRSLENIFAIYAKNIYPLPSLKMVKAKATVLDDKDCDKELQLRKKVLSACNDANGQYFSTQQCIQNEHTFEKTPLENTSVFIWISFVEIYNELVYDLLTPPDIGTAPQLLHNTLPRKNLKIMANDGKVFIKGLTSVYVKSSLEAQKLLHFGLQRVNYASTSINSNSSRSHCVFIVDVIKFTGSVAFETSYKFCDLAGSERLDKTGNVGSRLKEAQRINASLLVLGRCLDAANANTRKKNADVIPVRESKLTMLLQSALLGKEKLAMIVNVMPTDKFYDENLHVLGFSSIAKNIIYKQPIIKTNKSRYSWILSHASNTNEIDDKYVELLEENSFLRNELLRIEDELAQKDEELLQKDKEIWDMRTKCEQEKEQIEMLTRTELVDLYSKDIEEQKKESAEILKRELENLTRFYETKIDGLKRVHEAEIQDLREEFEDDGDELVPSKKRRSMN